MAKMKQMDKADGLFPQEKAIKDFDSFPRYLVEYDHPFQCVGIDYSGRIHVGYEGKSICGSSPTTRRLSTNEIIRCEDAPYPCPICFMQGDLLALRISPPKHTEMESDETSASRLTPKKTETSWPAISIGTIADLLMDDEDDDAPWGQYGYRH
jgi:hypothetical protein